MSVKIMGLVWDSDLRPTEKFVLLAYADHASHDGTNIFPAIKSMVEKTGFSERTVQNATRELERKGWLLADGKGQKATNQWRIPLNGPKGIHPAGNAPPQLLAKKGASPSKRGADKDRTPESPAPEPSLTIKEPPNKERDSRRTNRRVSIKNQIRGNLEVHFTEVSKLPPPKSQTDKQKRAAGELWWAPLREIAELVEWDEPRAKALITLAVRRMRADRLTISHPKSILNVARAGLAESMSVIGTIAPYIPPENWS